MKTLYPGRVMSALLAVAMAGVATVGCGGDDAPKEHESTRLMRAAVADVKKAGTAKVTFAVKLVAWRLSGTAEVAFDKGMSVTYTEASTSNGDDRPKDVNGELVVADGVTYQRFATGAPAVTAAWTRPDPAAKLGGPGSLTRLVSRLFDPLLTLDQGADWQRAVVERKDGGTMVSYPWSYDLDEPGGKLAAWSDQLGDSGGLNLTLTLDADGRLVSWRVMYSDTNTYFDATMTFAEYGTSVAITAPAGAPRA